jgi:hypothetical protein
MIVEEKARLKKLADESTHKIMEERSMSKKSGQKSLYRDSDSKKQKSNAPRPKRKKS